MSNVRTRFAPSPTGFLHVGGARAALFPWLLAKQNNGAFLLRIEDTDQAREVEGAVETIKQTLNWLGITWDEGPDIGGHYGPYVQSQRTASYLEWAKRLVDKGRAYADIRSPEELESLRDDAKSKKQPFLARNYRPQNPPQWQLGMPLRFLSDPKAYKWHDEIMGDLSASEDVVDDFILVKSDGQPTYNFAHVIDDHEMKITHVIRGLEYIASMPKYLNLYDALDIQWPKFAHMPHIMGADGKKKLSKRDGAKSILDYKKEGYLPEALLNFLALLGWNPGTTQEIFTKEELIKSFSLDRVQRSGARFDERRLIWMNGVYIRSLSIDELAKRAQAYWPKEAADYNEEYRKKVLALVAERLKYLAELPDLTRFFFSDLPVNSELIPSNKKLAQLDNSDLKSMLSTVLDSLTNSNFSLEDLVIRLNELLETTDQPPAVLFSLIRIATTQAPSSPALAESLQVIGKERALKRIRQQLDVL